MKLLLDTHTFIWWSSEPDRLSARVLSITTRLYLEPSIEAAFQDRQNDQWS